KQYVVDQYGWLTQRQFLDAVAVGLITPGPVVITATFVGFLTAGLLGALAATIGIFSPSVLFTLAASPVLKRYERNARVKGFMKGITVAVVGVLAGTSVMLANGAICDVFTAMLAVSSLLFLFTFRNVPEQVWILVGGLLGIMLFDSLKPTWVLK